MTKLLEEEVKTPFAPNGAAAVSDVSLTAKNDNYGHNWHGMFANALNGHTQQLPKYKRILAGLSGAGREGPSHIGALMLLDDIGLIPESGETPDTDGIEIVAKSSGGMVAAGYKLLRKKGYKNPAHELEQILAKHTDMYKFFGFFDIWRKKEGLIDPIRLEKFLDELLGDARFEDVPGLYIVVHNNTKRKDIIFGKVAKEYLIKDAVRASIALSGMIKPVSYSGETIRDEFGEVLAEKGDLLVDGGSMRRSAVREFNLLWPEKRKDDLRITAYVGRPDEENGFYANGNGYHTGFLTRLTSLLKYFDELRPIHGTKKRVGEKIKRDLDVKQDTTTTREWSDFREDVYHEFNTGISSLSKGHKHGVVAIMPCNGRVSVAEDGVPTESVKNGYEEAQKSILRYHREQEAMRRILRYSAEKARSAYLGLIELYTHPIGRGILTALR